jgi:hypothetical protein
MLTNLHVAYAELTRAQLEEEARAINSAALERHRIEVVREVC